MNLVLIAPEELKLNGEVTLSDHRFKHILKILKLSAGDSLRVGIINGNIGSGTVLNISKKEVNLSVRADTPPAPPPLIHLVLALPRPIMLKRVLAQATSIGVTRIDLLNANRVEKSFFNAKIVKEQNFLPFLINGLEQAVDSRVPEIYLHHKFKPFVEDILPSLSQQSLCLLAHPDANETLPQSFTKDKGMKIILAIGPEGGWVDFEVKKFQAASFKTFSLGPRILRVDTAVPAIMSQVNLLSQL